MMVKNFLENFDVELTELCNIIGFKTDHRKNHFFDYINLLDTRMNPFQCIILRNKLLNATALLNSFPAESEMNSYSQELQFQRIVDLKDELILIKEKIDQSVTFYLNQNTDTNDDLFSHLCIISKAIKITPSFEKFIKSITRDFKKPKNRSPKTLNFKLALILFKQIFEEILTHSRNRNIFVIPDQSLAPLLNISKDEHTRQHKIDVPLLTTSFLLFIGQSLNEKRVRIYQKFSSQELKEEYNRLPIKKYQDIDELFKTFEFSPPSELFESRQEFDRDKIEYNMAVLAQKVSLINLISI